MPEITIVSRSNTLWMGGECVGAARQQTSRDIVTYRVTHINPGLGLRQNQTFTVTSGGKIKAKPMDDFRHRPLRKR